MNATPPEAAHAAAAADTVDTIDTAAGLASGTRLHSARRFRAKVVQATQASEHALFNEPVAGLSTADRLRVAAHVCQLSKAQTLERHYLARLQTLQDSDAAPGPALSRMQHFAATLTTDPRSGDRAAIEALREAGLGDAAIVALAQLVAFLAYQTRVVAGLRAMNADPEHAA